MQVSASVSMKSVFMNRKAFLPLSKTLLLVMDILIKTKPLDDPVYLFLDKKRAQGKPYYVYMNAGTNLYKDLLYFLFMVCRSTLILAQEFFI